MLRTVGSRVQFVAAYWLAGAAAVFRQVILRMHAPPADRIGVIRLQR